MNTTIIDDAEGASLTLDAISEMVETMNETYKKMKMIPKHLYGEYYLREKAKFDANHVVMMYVGWKMTEWDETFDSLKDKQTQVVAEFLTKRPLRFSRRPSHQEVEAVQLSLVLSRLYYGFAFCEDFNEMFARFREFNSWEGDIMRLDYNLYGKYLLQNYHKMTEEERQSFFELDLKLELINKDMAKVMPKKKAMKGKKPLAKELTGLKAFAVKQEIADSVVDKITELIAMESKPKNIMRPIRAAMDAGVLYRPSWDAFVEEYGSHKVSSKTSLNDYTKPEVEPYSGESYNTLVDVFKKFLA